jgi:signal transduction histidine kinase
MKTIQVILLLLLPGMGHLQAQAPKPTPAKVEALVNFAVNYGKQHGKDQLIAQTNNPHGLFHVGDGAELYIFIYDHKGICKAIGFNTEDLVGVNRWELKDPNGVPMIKNFISIAETKGSGWTDYKYLSPATKTLKSKSSFVMAFEDLVVGSGLYKD